MESLTFDGSVTSDRQCVNITILDDDENESPSRFGSSLEIFQVRLNISELNDAVQLGIQTAFVSIEDDDCKFQQKQLQIPIFLSKILADYSRTILHLSHLIMLHNPSRPS